MSEAEKMAAFLVGCISNESTPPVRVSFPAHLFVDLYQEFTDMKLALRDLREMYAILEDRKP